MASLNVYCDEITRPDRQDLLILGALFIEEPNLKIVLTDLERCRCLNYPCRCVSFTSISIQTLLFEHLF